MLGLLMSFGRSSVAKALLAVQAVQRVNDGEKVILVRNKTSPDDIHGLHAAEGQACPPACSRSKGSKMEAACPQ